jgi:hypothetical protein
MTNLIIDINKMFDNEDSDLNLEILNLLSQIPNQDLYLTPKQDNKNLNSSKE